ncbi:hypothetical protein PIB30_044827 [Stylosanthes scabra]|uniref:Uncharacterized protein n=1 Tax=Stylosanthes scabra TaxID=79078 RepID=A0ABU6WFN5_9FABA|nr:hypothetical protein [Stylosanthes scabra]
MNDRNLYQEALSTSPSILRSGYGSFGRRLVQDGVVDTHSPLSIALWYDHHVAKPYGALNFLDESRFKEALNLLLGFSHFFWAHSLELLSYRFTIMYDGQLVAGKLFWQVLRNHSYLLGLLPYLDCWRSPSGFGLSCIFFSGGSRSTKRHPLIVSGFSSFGTCSLEMCKVALWHFAASCLSPRSTPTFPPLVMNFIVRMEVATTAPILLRVGLPKIAL